MDVVTVISYPCSALSQDSLGTFRRFHASRFRVNHEVRMSTWMERGRRRNVCPKRTVGCALRAALLCWNRFGWSIRLKNAPCKSNTEKQFTGEHAHKVCHVWYTEVSVLFRPTATNQTGIIRDVSCYWKARLENALNFWLTYPSFVLRQVRSLFQSEFSTECDIARTPSNCSLISVS
jgi:hypothetical protein